MNAMPTARIGLKPVFVTSAEAIPAEAMIVSASGRYESPALIAL